MSIKPSKKVDFHFVTGNPQSESEKRAVRSIVRSNASNRRWRLVRETAAKHNSLVHHRVNGRTIVNASPDAIDEDEASDVSSALERRIRAQKLANKSVRRASRTSSIGSTNPSDSPIKVANLAQYYLGLLPPTEVSEKSINRMLQGTATSYAQLFPSGKDSVVSQMAKAWFQQCLQTRGILHTALFCQAMRAQAVRPGTAAMSGNELVLCQTEAVHAINDKLQQSMTACDDESLRIVFSLTWHGSIKANPPAQSPRQAPLADLQALRLFMGVIACDAVHARGLDNMLGIRGGLGKVKMPGLAFLISYGDIVTASCNLTRPIWPYESYAQYNPYASVDGKWLHCTQRKDHILITLGHGFADLHRWLPRERASQIQLVFSDLAAYTRASHDFILGPPVKRNRAVMSDQRNAVQHSLMSLYLAEDDEFEERDLFELCWIAGVAYSFIAVFPLAPNAARFDRLARLIRRKISSPVVHQKWSQAGDLALWITTIGALCSIGTSDRNWYVELLQRELGRANIFNWRDLKAHLMEFLWFPTSSDLDGEQLWAETKSSSRVTMQALQVNST